MFSAQATVYRAVSMHPLHAENPAKPIPKRSPCSLQFQGWQRFDQPHNFHWDVPDFWDRLGVRRFWCQLKPMKTVGLLLCVATMWFLKKYEPSQSWYKSTLLKYAKCGFIWHVIAYSWTILTEWPQQGEANAGFKKGTRQTTTQALFTTNHRWLKISTPGLLEEQQDSHLHLALQKNLSKSPKMGSARRLWQEKMGPNWKNVVNPINGWVVKPNT